MSKRVGGGLLELRRLRKAYPGHIAVDEVSLVVESGEFFALLGPSGCGKTTTLRLVAGFEQPDSGEVWLNGELLNGKRPYERRVSTVFQNYALFPHLNVADNVAFGLRRQGINDIARRLQEVFELVRLTGKERRFPAELSGGERQRTALARSLVVHPDVLLLDEPLSALDPNLRKQVRAELKSLQRRVGITFLFVTHDQEEALSLSDRIAVMNAGRIEQVGRPEEVYLHPHSRFVAGFLGPVNWINGIGLRPEGTRLAREAPPPGSRFLPAVVMNATFLGNCFHIQARLPDGASVTAEIARSDHHFHPGAEVYVWWQPQDEIKPSQPE